MIAGQSRRECVSCSWEGACEWKTEWEGDCKRKSKEKWKAVCEREGGKKVGKKGLERGRMMGKSETMQGETWKMRRNGNATDGRDCVRGGQQGGCHWQQGGQRCALSPATGDRSAILCPKPRPLRLMMKLDCQITTSGCRSSHSENLARIQLTSCRSSQIIAMGFHVHRVWPSNHSL
ncbi:hypothetical protein LIA77_01866 [Sarocladium implicatum]|nr:hypothetical protein LIA77_01866 [Sarocladium implicatum]